MRHVIAELAARLPPEQRDDAAVRAMAAYGCPTRMHIVRLLAPRYSSDHMGEIDFSRANIQALWAKGYADAQRVLAEAPWERQIDPRDGVYLHDFDSETASG
jgi:NTE family protein